MPGNYHILKAKTALRGLKPPRDGEVPSFVSSNMAGKKFLSMEGYTPLVNVYITMEKSTIFHGTIHYFDWAIFNSFLYVYQAG